MVLVLLTFSISQYCIVPVYCNEAINALQYTLQGHTFANLRGYGILPLFEGTYTLQYIPKGEHQVLMTPGVFHYLYILPGAHLDLFAEKHPNIDVLINRLEALHENGDLATRLPIDKRVSEILFRIQNLSKYDDEVGFSLATMVINLLRQLYRQLQTDIPAIQPCSEELPAYINNFISNRIYEPVPDLINQLKHRFFIESKTLRNSWNLDSNANPFWGPIESPRAILNAIRLKLALFLLVNERLTVTEVSDYLSYNKIYHFSDHFKANFGFSPSKAPLEVFQ